MTHRPPPRGEVKTLNNLRVINAVWANPAKENEVLLRRLRKGSQLGLYTLICLNPEASVVEYALHDREILSAAPVIWMRRKDP